MSAHPRDSEPVTWGALKGVLEGITDRLDALEDRNAAADERRRKNWQASAAARPLTFQAFEPLTQLTDLPGDGLSSIREQVRVDPVERVVDNEQPVSESLAGGGESQDGVVDLGERDTGVVPLLHLATRLVNVLEQMCAQVLHPRNATAAAGREAS